MAYKNILLVILTAFSIFRGIAQNVIPQPLNIEMGGKEKFVITQETTILETSSAENSKLLKSYLRQSLGIDLNILKPSNNINSIKISLSSDILNKEGYELIVTNTGISININSTKGLFYATQTLAQIVEQQGDKLIVPYVKIIDSPRFEWRGTMLDVSRHFFDKAYIKKHLDLMAHYKFNVFHWHLTDDQGWRIEIKKYPKLTTLGAWRDDRRNEPWTYFQYGSTSGKPQYGGFYTQEDIKEIVKYASERHITVVPEIDLPGHSWAAIYAYNELACDGKVWKKPENAAFEFADPLCICNDNVVNFTKDVLDEVIALFPSEYIHIGGDECKHHVWANYPICQKIMKDEGLTTTEQLQSRFNRQMEQFINSKGRKMIGWDEILEGGVAKSTAIMSWRGEKGGVEAAKHGNKAVMSPSTFLYFDRENSELDWKKVYTYDPVPQELSAEEGKLIMGCQANLWAENVQTPEKSQEMLIPRIFALSEIAWSLPENKNTEKMGVKIAKQYDFLDKQNYNYYIPKVEFSYKNSLFLNPISLELMGCELGKIMYDISTTEEKNLGKIYSNPIIIKGNTTVTAICQLNNGKKSAPITKNFSKASFLNPITTNNESDKMLKYRYYQGDYNSVNQLDSAKAISTGTVSGLAFPKGILADKWGAVYEGKVYFDQDDIYTFYTKSDDGTQLYINNQLVVDNDSIHGAVRKEGQIALKKGTYNLKIKFFENNYGEYLEAGVKSQTLQERKF